MKIRSTKYGHWEVCVKPKLYSKLVEGIMDDFTHGRSTVNAGAKVLEVTISVNEWGESTCDAVFDNNTTLTIIRRK